MNKFLMALAALTLTSCSALGEASEVRFCNPEGHGETRVKTDFSAFRRYGVHDGRDGILQKISNCSTPTTLCFGEPFEIRADRAWFKRNSNSGKSFSIITKVDSMTTVTVVYSKDEGIIKILKEFGNKAQMSAPLIYENCSSFGRVFIDPDG